jgi:hypothetical protein
LSEIFQKLPSDPFFDEIDPYEWRYLYEAWAHKIELDLETKRRQAILIGSFWNPEAAQKMSGASPGTQFETDDEEFDKVFEEKVRSTPRERRKAKRKQRQVVK